MNAEEFVEQLRSAAPSVEELEEYGLEEEEIEEIRASFLASPVGLDSECSGSEVERLLAKYDCANVEVGLIRFAQCPQTWKDGLQVAWCEADVILQKAAGDLAMFDHASGEESLAVARDGGAFLEALSVLVRVFRERDDWKGRVDEVIDKCARAAGGDEFREFYGLLSGGLGAS